MHTGTALLKVTASRIAALLALVVLVGLLPWLSGRGAEYTILRARYADREPTAEALAAIRDELGLEQGPPAILLNSGRPGSATRRWARELQRRWVCPSR